MRSGPPSAAAAADAVCDVGRDLLLAVVDDAGARLRRAVGRAARVAAAEDLHRLAVRIARTKDVLELYVGETLVALDTDTHRIRLRPPARTIHDYARERLGMAESTVNERRRLVRGLDAHPGLRAALLSGRITRRKVVTVLPVVDLVGEAVCIARARALTVRGLVDWVKTLGAVPAEDAFVQAVIEVSPEQQALCDAAVEQARWIPDVGTGTPEMARLEVVCMEFIGSHESASEAQERVLGILNRAMRPAEPEPWTAARAEVEEEGGEGVEAWARRLLRVEETLEEGAMPLGEGGAVRPGREGDVPTGAAPEAGTPEDAANDDPAPRTEPQDWLGLAPPRDADTDALDAHLRRLHAICRTWAEAFGKVASVLREQGAWSLLGAPSWGAYCVDGLGLSAKTVGEHAALEVRMRELPALRAALRAGRLTFTKARAVARAATAETVEALIDEAARQTELDLREAAAADRKRKLCSEGRMGLSGSEERMKTFSAAILAAQLLAIRYGGAWIQPGEALAWVARHFLDTWEPYGYRPTAREERILSRTDGRCAAPGCASGFVQLHHVHFSSRGGGSEEWNLLPLCPFHHLTCLHHGWLQIEGRVGERLVLRTRFGPDGRQELWAMEGPGRFEREAA